MKVGGKFKTQMIVLMILVRIGHAKPGVVRLNWMILVEDAKLVTVAALLVVVPMMTQVIRVIVLQDMHLQQRIPDVIVNLVRKVHIAPVAAINVKKIGCWN